MIKAEGAECEGIAVFMSDSQVKKLDPFEGYPKKYDRVDLSMINPVKKTNFTGQAYIMNDVSLFYEPCEKYKIACCKTVNHYNELCG